MASREIQRFAVTIPAGTQIAAPAVTDLTMPTRVVNRITVIIPPGPNGLVGFELANSGVSVIPINQGQWIIANNDTLTWDLDGYTDSGAWQLIAYNVGNLDHTLQVIFEVDVVAPASTGVAAGATSVATINASTTPAMASSLPSTTGSTDE